MLRFEPGKNSVREIFDLLSGGVAPRPIALVSTVSARGQRNLSPFSFFNVFGSNPPTVGFSPSRRLRDATLKDTYRNLVETRECVIHAVTYPMVQQVSLASTEYPPEVDEFVKSGLTPIASERVRPARVKESPFQMECALKQLIPLGDGPASGNLALCEVLLVHVAPEIMSSPGCIDARRMDLVARLGGDTYVRASGAALFEVPKPLRTRGIGWDQLPDRVRGSRVLTANDLGQLGNSERIPSDAEVRAFVEALEPVEPTEESFERAVRMGDARRALAIAVAFGRAGEPRAAGIAERAAKAALDLGDRDLAWMAVVYSNLVGSGR